MLAHIHGHIVVIECRRISDSFQIAHMCAWVCVHLSEVTSNFYYQCGTLEFVANCAGKGGAERDKGRDWERPA